jgi:hypothetical protein
VAGGCLLALVATFGVWAQRQLLETDRWVETSDELLREPAVRNELATYLAAQIAGGTPYRAQVERAAGRALGSRQSEEIWRDVSRMAHRQFVAAIRDDRAGGTVVLELRPLAVSLARQVGLPGTLLPASTGRLTVLRPQQLDTAREVAEVLETVAWWSVVLCLGAFAGGLWLGRGGRMGVLAVGGGGLVLVGLAVLGIREVAGVVVADELAQRGAAEPAVEATWSVATSLLQELATGVLAAGAAALVLGLVGRRTAAS